MCWCSVCARKDWWTVSWPCGKSRRTWRVRLLFYTLFALFPCEEDWGRIIKLTSCLKRIINFFFSKVMNEFISYIVLLSILVKCIVQSSYCFIFLIMLCSTCNEFRFSKTFLWVFIYSDKRQIRFYVLLDYLLCRLYIFYDVNP